MARKLLKIHNRKMMMQRILPGVFLLMSLVSCRQFEFHPNEVRPDEKDLNRKNIDRIESINAQTDFNFILLGDTQRHYEDLEDFVRHVNGIDSIAFVLLAGDLVDFGLSKEYNWIVDELKKLRIPFVSVIGNHDLLANGGKIFRDMFGPDNFSFSYGKTKFICINTNSREYDYNGHVPDIEWLKKELQNDSGYDNIFVLSHVPPFSVDFDRDLELPYAEALAAQPKTRISLHGHEHHYNLSYPYPGGIPYLVAAAANRRSYVTISVKGNQYSINQNNF